MARSRAIRTEKRQNRVVRYLREVRAEVSKVVWPSQRATLNLTGVVLATMVVMSIALGFVDWIFTRLFALIIG
jgi:preprotein translocase subunit SecE